MVPCSTNQSVDGGYDQSKNWKVGRSDLSKTERSAAPSLKGGEKKRVHTKSYPTSNRNNSGRVGPIYLKINEQPLSFWKVGASDLPVFALIIATVHWLYITNVFLL